MSPAIPARWDAIWRSSASAGTVRSGCKPWTCFRTRPTSNASRYWNAHPLDHRNEVMTDTLTAFASPVRETKLSNGLTVLVQPVHTAPVVSFMVWYKVGSRNENAGITGISHLLEHMM